MNSLERLKTPWVLKSFSLVVVIFFVTVCLSMFLPWRQTVTGEGQVIVFSPMERPQPIATQIDARISKWHVNEGQHVKRGDLLVELEEVKPKFIGINQLSNLQGQKTALQSKRSATRNLINSLERQIDSLISMQNASVPNADLKISQSSDKLRASQQKFKAAEQNFKTAEINFQRRKKLFEKGLSSKRDLELAELSFVKTKSELEAAQAELDIAQRDISMAEYDFSKVSAETTLKVQEAEAKLAQAFDKLASINSDIYKIDITIANFESRIAQRKVYSPVDGQVTRVTAQGSAETIKAGSQLAIIVPESSDQAVELFISDYFAPLLSVGRNVRLQFSGFPALQFAGWPQNSIGTFPGIISVIDAASHAGEGNKYRIIVKPDDNRINKHRDPDWPDPQNLRPGTKTIGWVILDEVPLWFELWRILNGFPPSIMQSPNSKDSDFIKLAAK